VDEMHQRIARTLPFVTGGWRRVRMTPIERTDLVLPDDVLLAYDEAARAGVFGRFFIATPAYWWRPQGGAWLVADVDGTTRWAIVARIAEYDDRPR